MRAMRWVGAIGVVGFSVASGEAHAQQAELALSGGLVVDARGGERSGVGVSPALYWTGRDGELLARGGVTLLRGGDVVVAGSLGTVVRAGRAVAGDGILGLEFGASGEMAAASGWRSGRGRLWPRLVAERTGWRVAAGPVAGLAMERVDGVGSGQVLDRLVGEPDRASVGRTRRYHGISAEARVGGGLGSLTGGWSGVRSGDAEWQELSAGATVVLEGAVLSGGGGVRLGEAAGGWGGASAAVPMGRAAALVVEAGLYPSDPLLEREGGRYATIGLRVRSH